MLNKNQLTAGIECLLLSAMLGGMAGSLRAQQAPQFAGLQRLTNSEAVLKLSAPAGLNFRIDASTNLIRWDFLTTLRSAGSIQHTDSAAPFLASRFYRAVQVAGTNVVTGDHLATDAGDILIHPINHASFVMTWNGKTIYNDPVGGAAPYQGLPRADLIFVSHIHGDHFDSSTLNAVKGTNAVIVAPQAVFNSLSATLKNLTIVQTNGSTTNVMGLTIDSVPAYNSFHPIGTGNGYVLTIGGKRIYMSGDTGDIAEMRALQGIDVAFVCMNLPYTMSVNNAASAVREFRPRVVYPYHYQGYQPSDIDKFKQMVGTDLGVEVRLRKWY
jgi:L-ascorbate metabolism protein UlaG (beta-lactamase superfamily)